MKSRFAKIAYGIGNLGQALFFNTVQTFLIFFYTDVVRLDPGLVGLAFAISYGVWNAINDPLVGVLSDRTRTRWGRRIPYIALGTPLTFILFVLIWSPPLGGSPLTNPSHMGIFVYFAVIIALFDLAYTAVSVTYTALFPEAFEDLEERTEVSIYRQVAAMIGTALGLAITPVIVGALSERFGDLGGWTGAGLILGLVGGGAFGFSLLGSRERKESSAEEALPLTAAFKETFTNRSFLAFVGANLMICYVWSWLSHGALLHQVRHRRRGGADEPDIRRHVRHLDGFLSPLEKDRPAPGLEAHAGPGCDALCGLHAPRLVRRQPAAGIRDDAFRRRGQLRHHAGA